MATNKRKEPTVATQYGDKQCLSLRFWLDDLSKQDKNDIDRLLRFSNELYLFYIEWMRDNRTTSKKIIHHATYEYVSGCAAKKDYPTGYIQAIRDEAVRDMKSWNSNNPDKKWQLHSKRKENASIPLDRRTFTYKESTNNLTVSKCGKRLKTGIDKKSGDWFFEKHKQLGLAFDQVKSGRLGKKKKNRKWRYYIVFTFSYDPLELVQKHVRELEETLEKKLQEAGVSYDPADIDAAVDEALGSAAVIGVDRGIVHSYMTDAGESPSTQRHDNAVKRKYDYNVEQCKAKGSRNATKKMVELCQRRERFSRDCDHRYSKQLLDGLGTGDFICLEDLTGITARTCKKFEHSRSSNRRKAHWSHARLLAFLKYKAYLLSAVVMLVDPAYTSQRCPECGVIDAASRNGGNYKCTACGYEERADVVGAENVKVLGIGGIEQHRELLMSWGLYPRQGAFNRPNVQQVHH